MFALIAGAVLVFTIWAWPALYVPQVRDLRLVSLEPVSSNSFRPCADESIRCLESLPYDDYLRIRVTTKRNLMDFAVSHELNLWTEVWSCHLKPDLYAGGELIDPALYVDEEPIPYPSRRNVERFYSVTGKKGDSHLDYDIYLVPRWERTSNAHEAGKEQAPPYDISDGRDICARIRGGNMLGGHFVGNTVRITSKELRAALARR